MPFRRSATSSPCWISRNPCSQQATKFGSQRIRELHHLIITAGLQPVEAGMSAAEMRDERQRRWPETERQPASMWATRMWAQIMAPSSLA